jgi:ABC-type multidrug transport system fused ATPase/permease subunit
MKKESLGAVDTSAALSNLYLLISSTSRVSTTIVDLLSSFTEVGKLMQPIEHYYAVQYDLKPLLSLPQEPVKYGQGAVYKSPEILESEATEESSESGQETLVNPSVAGTPRLLAHPSLSGMSIRFENVSFTYPNTKKKALDSVSFTIEAGTLCSIVGQSGSGKSTLIALLVRLHDCDKGNICKLSFR